MHAALRTYIIDQIDEACAFVLRHMPIGLSVNEVYESLIGSKEVAQAFANAAQFLPASPFNRRMAIMTEEWGSIALNLRFSPTDKYPVFLLPKFTPYSSTLTRGSALSRALHLPMRVARDWKMLMFAFTKLTDEVEDASALACVMPWMREHVAEWAKENLHPTVFRPTKDRVALQREVDVILCGRAPKRFPRLTEPLHIVCQSGRALFSQYRMLTASHFESSPVILDRAGIDIPDWLTVHLDEVLEDWTADELHHKELEYERIRLKGKRKS